MADREDQSAHPQQTGAQQTTGQVNSHGTINSGAPYMQPAGPREKSTKNDDGGS